jgi:hypothetical protein
MLAKVIAVLVNNWLAPDIPGGKQEVDTPKKAQHFPLLKLLHNHTLHSRVARPRVMLHASV